MSETMIKYAVAGPIATITLDRPEQANALRLEMIDQFDAALRAAHRDSEVKVIILEGSGDNFSAGFDFSGGLAHFDLEGAGAPDPGKDMQMVTDALQSYIPKFMGLYRGSKPSIAKVHGYCLGGASELALCADLVIASEDARIGTPYSRVWGCHLTGMWVYRLGLAKAKYYALTGEWISGKDAAAIELINFAYPLEQLDAEVQGLAERLASIPASQLAAMKLIVNQAYDNMGLQSTQTLGPILDGVMRYTAEGQGFIDQALQGGVGAAVAARDAPFGDYSQAPAADKPRKRSEL